MRYKDMGWVGVALVLAGAGCELQRDEPNTRALHAEPGRLVIADSPCENCDSLGLEKVAVLGGPDDPVAFRHDAASRDCMVAQTSGGEFLVSGLIGGGQVARFNADGTFDQVFGRRGQGPGELGADLRISVGPGDSIVVIDDSQSRASIFDRSGAFARSFQVPAMYRPWTLRDDGSLVVSQDPATAGGPAFTILSMDGETSNTIMPPLDWDETTVLDSWVVSASSRSGLWVASTWEYEVLHLGEDGEIDITVQRNASWFPSGGGYQEGMPTTVRTPPLVRFVREISPDTLMVVTVVADPAWEPDIPPTPGYEWGRRVFDTRIEVLDIHEGTVVASTLTDEWLGAVCGSDLMYTVAEGPDLNLQIHVWRPAMSIGTTGG